MRTTENDGFDRCRKFGSFYECGELVREIRMRIRMNIKMKETGNSCLDVFSVF